MVTNAKIHVRNKCQKGLNRGIGNGNLLYANRMQRRLSRTKKIYRTIETLRGSIDRALAKKWANATYIQIAEKLYHTLEAYT